MAAALHGLPPRRTLSPPTFVPTVASRRRWRQGGQGTAYNRVRPAVRSGAAGGVQLVNRWCHGQETVGRGGRTRTCGGRAFHGGRRWTLLQYFVTGYFAPHDDQTRWRRNTSEAGSAHGARTIRTEPVAVWRRAAPPEFPGAQLVPRSHRLLSSREAPPSVETATEAASASGESPRRGRRLPRHCKRQASHTGPVSEVWTSHRAIEHRAFTINSRIPLGADSPPPPPNSM